MGNGKKIGVVVLVIGLLALILSLIYDKLGGSAGIGPNQTIGIIVSAIITLVGAFLTLRKTKTA